VASVEAGVQKSWDARDHMAFTVARWRKPRKRVIFILCGAAGLRIGEALGIEIDKHISADFLTLHVQQKVRRG